MGLVVPSSDEVGEANTFSWLEQYPFALIGAKASDSISVNDGN